MSAACPYRVFGRSNTVAEAASHERDCLWSVMVRRKVSFVSGRIVPTSPIAWCTLVHAMKYRGS